MTEGLARTAASRREAAGFGAEDRTCRSALAAHCVDWARSATGGSVDRICTSTMGESGSSPAGRMEAADYAITDPNACNDVGRSRHRTDELVAKRDSDSQLAMPNVIPPLTAGTWPCT